MTDVTKFNEQSVGEEIGNAISHGVGSALSIAGTVLLIVRAALHSDAMGIVGACLYGASLMILFTFSCLYHSLTSYRAKRVFQVFDHCSIFILILGTYTVVCFTLLRGTTGWIMFGINAALTVIGVVFNSINLAKWHKASLILYILMGWSVLICIKDVLTLVSPAGLFLLAGGGVVYTVGVIFYQVKKKFFHFVWHFFVLGGAIMHWFFVYFTCFPVK